MTDGFRRWLPVAVVTVALALAGLTAASGGGLSGRELPPSESFLEPLEPAEPSPQETPPLAFRGGVEDGGFFGGNPALLTYLALFTAIFLAVVLYAVYHFVRWLLNERIVRRSVRARPASQPDAAAEAAEVLDALRAGLADIDAGGDARRAIIACWLRLERVAAAAGSARLVADTPGDLVERLLSRHLISRDALERLAAAYRQARYAPAAIGDDLAVAARAALQEVSRELSAPRGAVARASSGAAVRDNAPGAAR
jgi:hypothetical protein